MRAATKQALLCALACFSFGVSRCLPFQSGSSRRVLAGQQIATRSFIGSRGGDERQLADVKLCWCPPGRFIMGSPPDETERRPTEDQVEVTLTRGFWMGKYGVTQGQWKRVMGRFPGQLDAGSGDDFPVYSVNFAEAEEFCRRLTHQLRLSGALPQGLEFRIPTEAQREYACRAGTTTATAFGDRLSSRQANFDGSHPYNGAIRGPYLRRTEQVGRYPANRWGLHDMHGNLDEWCRDVFYETLPGGTDPDLSNAKSPGSRARRGGVWDDPGWACRSASRRAFEPERRANHIGFRVVMVQL